jgi:hypothetical protein
MLAVLSGTAGTRRAHESSRQLHALGFRSRNLVDEKASLLGFAALAPTIIGMYPLKGR